MPTSEPAGYASDPGGGPAGQTCGTCSRVVRVRVGERSAFKCRLVLPGWTSTRRTDVAMTSPACERWAEGQGRP